MKTILAKGYYGLGGSIAVLSCAMRLAELTNSRLIIDWVDGVYGVDGLDIFNHVFESPNSNYHSINEVSKVWPDIWQSYYKFTMPYKTIGGVSLSNITTEMIENSGELNGEMFDCFVVSREDKYWHRSEYSSEISEYVRKLTPIKSIRNKIESYDLGEECIGVHFRHGNGEKTVVPPDLCWFFEKIDCILLTSPDSKILLCTDCIRVLDLFKDKYPQRVISSEKEYPPLGSGSMHLNNDSMRRLKAIEEAIVDIWLMSRCKFLIGSKSFFTGVALRLNESIQKSDVKIWQPKWRSHSPTPDQFPVAENSFVNSLFESNGLLSDGVYFEFTQDRVVFYYLHNELLSFESLESLDLFDLGLKIKSIRYY